MGNGIDLSLTQDGEVQGIRCGLRASGLTVARNTASGPDGALTVLLPSDLAFAPSAYAAVAAFGTPLVRTTSDGRITSKRGGGGSMAVSAEDVLESLEEAVSSGPGGLPERAYGGVYTVRRAGDAWAYEVTTTPSGRASLKRIGTWTGTEGTFRVVYEAQAELAALLDKAESAKVKGVTNTVSLPHVPGVDIRVDGGEILVSWPGEAAAAVLREVRTLRWDTARRAYAVSTRYSGSLAKALQAIAALREREQAAHAAAAADRRAAAQAAEVSRRAAARAAAAERQQDAQRRAVAVEAVRAAERAAQRAADEAAGIVRLTVFVSRDSDYYYDRLPAVGSVVHVQQRGRDYGPLYVQEVVKGRYMREDGRSFGWDDDSGWLYEVVYCRPDPMRHAAAIQAFEQARAKARAERERASRLSEVSSAIRSEGSRPVLGVVPPHGGEVLGEDRPDLALYGGGARVVRASDGALWHVQGNSGDGDSWSNNDVSGGIGYRVPPGPRADELAQRLRSLAA